MQHRCFGRYWGLKFKSSFLCLIAVGLCFSPMLAQAEFEREVLPFLEKYCVKCHGGEKTKGDVDLSKIKTMADADSHPDLWETVSFVLEDREMPPEDEAQPTEEEVAVFSKWYKNDYLGKIESKPGIFQPRRLSGPEYRNTMRSLFGFDLEVNVVEAEQTITEKSIVMKLLPTDPPGASGFVNDTRAARLSTTIWDQYSYLADFALEQFSSERTGPLNSETAEKLVRNFVPRAFRRPVSEDRFSGILKNLEGKSGDALEVALKAELKTVLMSPAFLYRGFLMPTDPKKKRQPVDDFELAERLSYFIWEDMPDRELFEIAVIGDLKQPEVMAAQIDRMIASPKSRTLAESFGSQWLLLDQIKDQRNDPVNLKALKNQPLDFLHYLFTENRQVMELVDSKVTFANDITAKYYGNDRKQLKRVNKPKGVERMATPNQKIDLITSVGERGGIITMPGVLAMNEGPIQRGTWMLRQLLGEHLGEPPPDIPPIQSSPKGKNLSFRERFEQHRSDKSCALCHDKIDPLGFALEGYNKAGDVIRKEPTKKKGGIEKVSKVDTSGQMPNGKAFANFTELKSILMTDEREKITRNAIEQTMAYALCRKLERGDRPTVDALTTKILDENGTWRDLIHGIANSVPFRETLNVKKTLAK